MKIYGNSELTKLRAKIDGLLKLFSSKLDSVNNAYTPIYTKVKKRRSNIIYYIGMTLFLLIIISFAVFLDVFEAYYLILIAYGINLILTGLGLFLFQRVNKEYKKIKNDWDKEYQEVLQHQDEITQLYSLAEAEVYKVICLTIYNEELKIVEENEEEYNSLFQKRLEEVKIKIKEELGVGYTSEAVVAYYIEWGARVTKQTDSDYDYLEMRRRKAEIRSKNIDIASERETEDE